MKVITVVTLESRLNRLKRKQGTLGAAKFLLEQTHLHSGVKARSETCFSKYEREHEVYEAAVRDVLAGLSFDLPVQRVDRQYLANYDFSRSAVVVVVGPDGLVANTAKYASGVPIVGVNPDVTANDGFLVPFMPKDAQPLVRDVLAGKGRVDTVCLAEVRLNNGQVLRAFNDLFIGRKTHVSARYVLRVGEGVEETQSSSGVVVSTGAGATGWLSSMMNMARNVAAWSDGDMGFPELPRRTDRELIWSVREPFISRHSSALNTIGRLVFGNQLELESIMPAGGVIFSDGIEEDYLDFTTGTIAQIGVSDEQALLVVA